MFSVQSLQSSTVTYTEVRIKPLGARCQAQVEGALVPITLSQSGAWPAIPKKESFRDKSLSEVKCDKCADLYGSYQYIFTVLTYF